MTTPVARHRVRMLVWLAFALSALAVVVVTCTPGSFDTRHLMVVIGVAGLVLEAEWTP